MLLILSCRRVGCSPHVWTVDSGWSAAAGDDLPQGGSGVANGLVVPVALNPSLWASRRADQRIFSLGRQQQ
jgi:hypothetical protein